MNTRPRTSRSLPLAAALAVGLLAGLAGGATGAWLMLSVSGSGAGQPGPSAMDRPPDRLFALVDALSEHLDRETEERLRLEDRVADLERGLTARTEPLSGTSPPAAPAAQPADAAPGPRGGAREDSGYSAFLEAGFSEDEARWYEQLRDEAAMARLYIRDQAAREGWLNSPRFGEALAELPGSLTSLQASMDEETFARYLYAIGRPNQVRVNGVLDGSAAASAGLEADDVILRYAGERLYGARTLRDLTRRGEAGELVAIEVRRDDQLIQTFVPRGPLGVNITSERGLPPSP